MKNLIDRFLFGEKNFAKMDREITNKVLTHTKQQTL